MHIVKQIICKITTNWHQLYCTPLVCLFYSVFYLYGAAACQLFIKRICYVMLCYVYQKQLKIKFEIQMSKMGHYSLIPIFLPIVYVPIHRLIPYSGWEIRNALISFPPTPTKLFPCSLPFPQNYHGNSRCILISTVPCS